MKSQLTYFFFACLTIIMVSCGNINDDCLDPEIVAKFNQERVVEENSSKSIEFIDLGLPSGTKWMKYNVGAYSEYEFGIYATWEDAKSLLPEECSMPTYSQAIELVKNCTWHWSTQTSTTTINSNVNGYKSISGYEGRGPNGNWIFLPAAGLYPYLDSAESLKYLSTVGEYWVDLTENYSTASVIHIEFNQDESKFKPILSEQNQDSKLTLRGVKK